MKVLIRLGVGVVLSGLTGVVAYRHKSLTRSGVFGAVLVGTAIVGFGGWMWGLLLITFFVLSSLFSHYKASAKVDLAEKFAKGHQRDLGQVLANGGVGALVAVTFLLCPQPAAFVAFVGSMATVNADTWATELGVLSKRLPRLLTSWRRVEPGTSGGVSALGTWAALAGAATIGLVAVGLVTLDGILSGDGMLSVAVERIPGVLSLVPVATLSGLAGAFFDSLLGATVQAIYYDPWRHKETERRCASAGQPNVHQRGWRWLGNDLVNLFSSLVGALVAVMIWHIVH